MSNGVPCLPYFTKAKVKFHQLCSCPHEVRINFYGSLFSFCRQMFRAFFKNFLFVSQLHSPFFPDPTQHFAPSILGSASFRTVPNPLGEEAFAEIMAKKCGCAKMMWDPGVVLRIVLLHNINT